MNWLQCIILGLISGISEFLPISSSAHIWITAHLFGIPENDPIRALIIHIAILAALIVASRGAIETILRERRMAARGAKVYNRRYRGNMDFRLLKNTTVYLILGYLVISYIVPAPFPIPVVVCMLLLNGIILYLPTRMLQGNKDARSMSKFDSFLIGLAGATSALTGISRIATITSVATMRGADRSHAANWALLLSTPMLIVLIILDLAAVFSGALTLVSTGFGGYLLIAISAFLGAYVAISSLKFLSVKAGFSTFSYYSWGAALFLFILYLI